MFETMFSVKTLTYLSLLASTRSYADTRSYTVLHRQGPAGAVTHRTPARAGPLGIGVRGNRSRESPRGVLYSRKAMSTQANKCNQQLQCPLDKPPGCLEFFRRD